MVIRYAYAMVVKHGSKGSTNVAGSMVGRTFNNRYTLTERVGLGGMAEVYRAQDNVLGRTVAVKVMLPQYAADPTFTKRFRQEAASAANLQSPYIVSIYDWGLDGETYYIVMVSGRKGWPAPSRMPKPSVCTSLGVIIPSAMPGME